MNIQGSVVLVTGANRGIGRSFVAELLERGAAKVYAGARDPQSVVASDPRVVPVRLDVTSDEQVAALAAELGDVTVVINNAGIGRPGAPLDATLDDAREQFETNVLGIVRTTQAFAPILATNDGGAIVNVLSIVSWMASPVLSTYSATKAAAWSYTNSSRVQLKAQGTQVVGVHVGYVDTDLTAGFDVEKVSPQTVAISALDALEAGAPEALVDETTRSIKAGLSDEHALIYPTVQEQWDAAVATV